MPRFKLKGVLERDPLADLWRHTLAKIPTTYGRLVYLANLRDPRTGSHQHYGLAASFGREESKRALAESHHQVFLEWLGLSLPEKAANLRSYLASQEPLRDGDSSGDPAGQTEAILRYWLRSGQHRIQFPATASAAEREMFVQELDVLVKILMTEAAGAAPDQGSSRHA